MLLTPRYDGPPVLRCTERATDPATPVVRQRRRLAALLGDLDESQWAAPSRCAGWTVQDVVAHLVSTDQFWFLSATAGLAGEPTRFLSSFDPVATPPALVEGMGAPTPAELLATYQEGVAVLTATLEGIDGEQWELPAEAPPGHVPLHALADHALWDAWIHERDILLPLGLVPAEEPDEVQACLRYAAALGPVFLATRGSDRPGTLVVEGTDPEVRVVVEAGATVVVGGGPVPEGAVHLAGPSVALVEGLSLRDPLPGDAVDPADRWLLDGLATVFDVGASA